MGFNSQWWQRHVFDPYWKGRQRYAQLPSQSDPFLLGIKPLPVERTISPEDMIPISPEEREVNSLPFRSRARKIESWHRVQRLMHRNRSAQLGPIQPYNPTQQLGPLAVNAATLSNGRNQIPPGNAAREWQRRLDYITTSPKESKGFLPLEDRLKELDEREIIRHQPRSIPGDFDVAEWFFGGGNPADLLEVAGAPTLARLARGKIGLYGDLNNPMVHRVHGDEVSKLVEFYRDQFKSHRWGHDNDIGHESYRSLLRRSPLGSLIERGLADQIDTEQASADQGALRVRSLLQEMDTLKHQRDAEEISGTEFQSSYSSLVKEYKSVRKLTRQHGRQARNLADDLHTPLGEIPETRYVGNPEAGQLASWEDILRRKLHLRTGQIDQLRAAFPDDDLLDSLEKKGYGPSLLHDVQGPEIREQLERIRKGLSSQLLGLSEDEVNDLRAVRGAREVSSHYTLRAMGALPGVGNTPIMMTQGHLFGHEAVVHQGIDLNHWEFRDGEWVERENPALGLGRAGYMMTPADILPHHMLAGTTFSPIPGSEVTPVRQLLAYGKQPFFGTEDLEHAEGEVYDHFSRGIRRIVGEASYGMAASPSPEVSKDLRSLLTKVSPHALDDPDELISELLAYAHIHPNFVVNKYDNEYTQVLNAILGRGHEGEPYIMDLRARLQAILPDIESTVGRDGHVNINKYVAMVRPVMHQHGITTAQHAVKAQILSANADRRKARRNEVSISEHATLDFLANTRKTRGKKTYINSDVPSSTDTAHNLMSEAANRVGRGDKRVVNDLFDLEAAKATKSHLERTEQTEGAAYGNIMRRIEKLEQRLDQLGSNDRETAEAITAPFRAAALAKEQLGSQAAAVVRQHGVDPNAVKAILSSGTSPRVGAVRAYQRHMLVLRPERMRDAAGEIDERVQRKAAVIEQIKGGDETEVQSAVRSAMRRHFPEFSSIMDESIAHGPQEDEGLVSSRISDYGTSLNDIFLKRNREVGNLHQLNNPTVSTFYRQLGGEGDPALRLSKVHLLTDNIFTIPLDRHWGRRSGEPVTEARRLAEDYTLPEEMTQGEKEQLFAAIHLPRWLEDWAQNPEKAHLAQLEDGQLTESAKQEALNLANTILTQNKNQWNQWVEYHYKELINPKPDEASLSHLHSQLEYLIRKENEEWSEEQVFDEADHWINLFQEGIPNMEGGRLRMVSNSSRAKTPYALGDIHPQGYIRNTVTRDRADANQRILQHYMGWNDKDNHLVRRNKRYRTLISDSKYFPQMEGETLDLGLAKTSLNKALEGSGLDWDRLSRVSAAFEGQPVSLNRMRKGQRKQLLEELGLSGEYNQSAIYSPFSLGGWVETAPGHRERLSDVFGRYLVQTREGPEDLIRFGQEHGYDVTGLQDREEIAASIFGQSRGAYDFRRASTEQYLSNYFKQQAEVMRNGTLQSHLTERQRRVINDAIGTKPGLNKVLPTADEQARLAEEAFLKKPTKMKRITRNDLRALFRTRKGKIGVAAAGTFAAWGVSRAVSDRQTVDDVQGPRNLPGGNPYNGQASSLPRYGGSAIPQGAASGITYVVRAQGNFDPDDLQANVINITGGSVQSGSVYDTPARPDPDQDMQDAMDKYK